MLLHRRLAETNGTRQSMVPQCDSYALWHPRPAKVNGIRQIMVPKSKRCSIHFGDVVFSKKKLLLLSTAAPMYDPSTRWRPAPSKPKAFSQVSLHAEEFYTFSRSLRLHKKHCWYLSPEHNNQTFRRPRLPKPTSVASPMALKCDGCTSGDLALQSTDGVGRFTAPRWLGYGFWRCCFRAR